MIKNTLIVFALILLNLNAFAQQEKNAWIKLWDGKTFSGWEASENPESFSIQDNAITVEGERAHLFYVGSVMNHDFKNFELKAEVMTEPGANSGIFFHTKFQEEGWPSKGYEIQVNQTHSDWRKTASVYSFDDVKDVYVEDNEWCDMHIIVRNDTVSVKINDETVVEYIESKDENRAEDAGEKKIDSGTFALQAHDPESVVYFKNILVKPLP